MSLNREPILRTRRLTLRGMTPADKAAAVAIFLDAEVARTYMLPEFSAPEEAEALFDRFMALSNLPERFVYGVYRDTALVGFVNEVEKTDREIEVGYVIATPHKGQGYATEMLTAVIGELFRMGYAAVRAGAFSHNRASMRVMEKSGMTCQGPGSEVEYRGTVYPCIDYAIFAEK